MSEYTQIGSFVKTHGFKGTLILMSLDSIIVDWEKVESLLCGNDVDNSLPVFLEDISIAPPKIFVKLEEVNSSDAARILVGKNVYCKTDFIRPIEKTISEGYHVQDLRHGSLGIVKEVYESPGQEIIVTIDDSGIEILLPNIPQFVISVDHEKKKITYSAPEGLIEIYRN
jgi:16S rRNA processing protein RimM